MIVHERSRLTKLLSSSREFLGAGVYSFCTLEPPALQFTLLAGGRHKIGPENQVWRTMGPANGTVTGVDPGCVVFVLVRQGRLRVRGGFRGCRESSLEVLL